MRKKGGGWVYAAAARVAMTGVSLRIEYGEYMICAFTCSTADRTVFSTGISFPFSSTMLTAHGAAAGDVFESASSLTFIMSCWHRRKFILEGSDVIRVFALYSTVCPLRSDKRGYGYSLRGEETVCVGASRESSEYSVMAMETPGPAYWGAVSASEMLSMSSTAWSRTVVVTSGFSPTTTSGRHATSTPTGATWGNGGNRFSWIRNSVSSLRGSHQ